VRAVLAIALVFSLAAPARAADDVYVLAERGERLLDDWQIEEAAEIAAELEQRAPEAAAVKHLLGRVAFEQGGYAVAVELLTDAAGARADRDLDVLLAKGALEETRNFVLAESEHFAFRSSEKDALLAPYALEMLEAAHAALTRELGWSPPGKVRVEVYGTPRALARVSTLSETDIKTSGTIALCKYNRLMFTSPRALVRGYAWMDTVAHEFVHYLVTRKSRNTVPIWLHEGLAKYLESAWRGAPGDGLDPSSELLLQDASKRNKLITFAQMHPSIAKLPSQEAAALAFAEVYTAIEHLARAGGEGALRRLVEKLRDGATDRAAVSATAGMPFEKWETEWKRALATRRPPAGAARATLRPLRFRDDRGKSEDDYEEVDREASDYARLGELLRQRDRHAAAAIEFKRALDRVGATSPAISRKYALSLVELGRYAEAERALADSVALYPDEAPAHVVLGRIYARTESWDAARTHLELANRVDPFDPEIHASLRRIAEKTGDAALKAREESALRILSGASATVKTTREEN
jgi:tetratricopeptide (TPR) repeat protein